MKKLIFQFFDKNLLSAWFKDERPQGLSWHSALKGYYTILWQNYKNLFSGFFFLVKMVFDIISGYAHAKVNLKNAIKGILYDFEKKKWKILFFNFLMKICCRQDLRMSALKG